MGSRKLVSIGDAAELCGVSTKTIRRYIARGELSGFRLGPRLIRVDLAEVEQLGQRIPTRRSA